MIGNVSSALGITEVSTFNPQFIPSRQQDGILEALGQLEALLQIASTDNICRAFEGLHGVKLSTSNMYMELSDLLRKKYVARTEVDRWVTVER